MHKCYIQVSADADGPARCFLSTLTVALYPELDAKYVQQ